MRNDKKNIIVELSVEFALKIISFSEELESIRKFDLSRQIFKSGTSIGANIREAQNAESKADFIHKMKIAAKEAEETAYWLELCRKSENYPSAPLLETKVVEILMILSKIISSAKK